MQEFPASTLEDISFGSDPQPFQPQAPTGELAGGDPEPFYRVHLLGTGEP